MTAAANAAGIVWRAEVNRAAHSEICAVPDERLAVERDLLRSLPSLRAQIGKQVLRKVDADEVVELTRALVRIPSVYRPGDPEATEARVAEFVEAWLRREGLTQEHARLRCRPPGWPVA